MPSRREPGLLAPALECIPEMTSTSELSDTDDVSRAWAEFDAWPSLDNYRRLRRSAELDGSWTQCRRRALRLLRQRTGLVNASSQGSVWTSLSGGDSSVLVGACLWVGDAEGAWEAMCRGGCSPDLLLELTALREKTHPEEVLAVYRLQMEESLVQGGRRAYPLLEEWLARTRNLLVRLGRQQELADLLGSLRQLHGRKRRLIRLLDALEPAP